MQKGADDDDWQEIRGPLTSTTFKSCQKYLPIPPYLRKIPGAVRNNSSNGDDGKSKLNIL